MAAKVSTKQRWEWGLPLGVSDEMRILRLFTRCNVCLVAVCVELFTSVFRQSSPTGLSTQKACPPFAHISGSVNWAHLSQNGIKSELIARQFYLFMSSYRQRQWGNWFYNYQRAETARVRDKRVKKTKKTVYIYCFYIPSSLPLSFHPSPRLNFFLFPPLKLQNHQTTILLSARLVTDVGSPFVFNAYNMHSYSFAYCTAPVRLYGGP